MCFPRFVRIIRRLRVRFPDHLRHCRCGIFDPRTAGKTPSLPYCNTNANKPRLRPPPEDPAPRRLPDKIARTLKISHFLPLFLSRSSPSLSTARCGISSVFGSSSRARTIGKRNQPSKWFYLGAQTAGKRAGLPVLGRAPRGASPFRLGFRARSLFSGEINRHENQQFGATV